MGEVIHVCRGEFQTAQEEVVNQYRRYGDSDTDAGGDQRVTDGTGDRFKAGRACFADAFKRFHDSPHRAEQTNERRGAANTGEDRLTVFQGATFLLDLLAQVAFQAIRTVDGVRQLLGGTRRIFHQQRFETAAGDTRQRARILAGVFGGGEQIRRAPEGFAELFVLRFLPQVLRRLDQQDRPADHGKQHQTPEHAGDNHRRQIVHGDTSLALFGCALIERSVIAAI
ncbi:hypothetical protein D3C72_797090 [compost metagenome]